MKNILFTMGTLVAIVSLAMFMFTSSSTLFTILSGIGCVSVMLMYDDYKKFLWEKEHNDNSHLENSC